MIQIISDSTCDLSKELIDKYNIVILPLHVHMGEEEYEDGVNITPDEIYAWADANKTTPKTSAASLEAAMKLFRQYTDKGYEIISFSISDEMSTNGNVMRLAAKEAGLENMVHVINSANLSTGVGLLVLEAAQMVQEGKSASQIVEAIEQLKPKVRASFVVDTLTYLHRGGRCSSVAALAGGVLKLHPRIAVENGRMDAGKKYRGKMQSVILSYVKDMEEELRNADPKRVFITHSGCEEETVNMVKEYLEGLSVFEETCVTRAGSVISSHCGPGTLGVLFISLFT